MYHKLYDEKIEFKICFFVNVMREKSKKIKKKKKLQTSGRKFSFFIHCKIKLKNESVINLTYQLLAHTFIKFNTIYLCNCNCFINRLDTSYILDNSKIHLTLISNVFLFFH